MTNNYLIDSKDFALDIYDAKSNVININNQNDVTYHFSFSSFFFNNVTINVINSNVKILFEFGKDIDEAKYTLNIDSSSDVTCFLLIVDTNKTFNLLKEINNNGRYLSMQIDLSDNNVNSIENININGRNVDAKVIDGIYASSKVRKDYQTNLNHFEGESISNAKIFAINDEYANVTIHTDAFIKNKARQTKTSQEGRIINLTDTCSGIVFPDLHIDENDVEASHSCSVGSVNQDHLYYLQTRGLSEKQARSILIKGYFTPILLNINDEKIKERIEQLLTRRIG